MGRPDLEPYLIHIAADIVEEGKRPASWAPALRSVSIDVPWTM